MKKDNARDYLPLVQALAEGKTIQYKTIMPPEWVDIDSHDVDFVLGAERYRIKPEPREIWVNRRNDGRHGAATYNSREEAARGIFEGWTPIRYREVIE